MTITMEIYNSLALSSSSPTAISNKSNTTSAIEPQTKNSQTDTLSISNVGEIAKEIDDLFEQMDQIYMSKLTNQQQSDIKAYYQQVDDLFDKENLTPAGEEKLDELLTNIDNIYQLSEQKFTEQDWKSLDALDQKADRLIEAEDEYFDKLDQELIEIEEKQYALISSQLSNKETTQLASYHAQIESLFDATNDLSDTKNQHLGELFSKIENILHSGFEKLSEEQKQAYNNFELKMSHLSDKYDEERAK